VIAARGSAASCIALGCVAGASTEAGVVLGAAPGIVLGAVPGIVLGAVPGAGRGGSWR
jgi:hypothetical protein